KAEGDVSASFGEFGYKRFTGYLTGPLVKDKAAASFSVVAYGDDGYIDNVFLNVSQAKREVLSLRGKLLYQPTEKLEVSLNGFYSESSDNTNASGFSPNGNSQARTLPNPTGIPLNILIPTGEFQTATTFDPEGK